MRPRRLFQCRNLDGTPAPLYQRQLDLLQRAYSLVNPNSAPQFKHQQGPQSRLVVAA